MMPRKISVSFGLQTAFDQILQTRIFVNNPVRVFNRNRINIRADERPAVFLRADNRINEICADSNIHAPYVFSHRNFSAVALRQ